MHLEIENLKERQMEMERGCQKKMKMYHKKIKLHIPDIGKKSGWERQDIAFKDDKTE